MIQRKKASGQLLTLAVLLGLLLPLLMYMGRNPYLDLVGMRVFISCVMAVGLDICTGVSGQVSLGQAGFMAIGGYIAAKIMQVYTSGVALAAALLLCVVVVGVLSFAIGFFILRLKGDYLGIATMALGEMICLFFETSEFFGKSRGLFQIHKYNNLLFSSLLFVAVFAVGVYFLHSKVGFLSFATGQDETAAKSIGVDTVRLKVFSFVLSAVVCALAGVLYSGTLGFISPSDFDFARSTDCLAAVILGGPRTIVGPAIAAVVIELSTIFLQPIAAYRMVIYGVLLVYVGAARYGGVQRKGGKRRA